MAEFPWGFSKAFFVCPGKSRVVAKTAGVADLGHWSAGGNQVFCQQKPLRGEIVSDGVAGLFLKGMHQIVSAQIKAGRQIIDRDILRQMLVQVIQNCQNLLVGGGVVNKCHMIVKSSTV